MATLAREAVVRQLPARRWHPSLDADNLRNTVLLTTPTPVLPPRFYDTTQWRPLAKWNSAVYFDFPNTTIRLPPPAAATPIFPVDFGPQLIGPRRNASLYYDSPNVTITAQAGFIGSPVRPVDLTPRLTARQPLNIEYPPNLSLSILTSNPYIPVDVSGRSPAPKRNAALYFDTPNITVALSAGQRPVIPVDWNMRAAVRQPIVFDAPNLAVRLASGARPVVPADISPPVRPAVRPSALYEAQGTLLPTLLFVQAVRPPGSSLDVGYSVISARFAVRRNPPAAEWIEPQRSLLSKPIVTASIPNLAYITNSGIQTYNASTAFSGATSYSIAPAPDAGITFNTVSGVITTDTGVASVATHGPYTITATNANGSVASNAFTISVSAGNYHVDGPRLTESTTSLGATYTVSGPHCTRDAPESKDLS